jgi:hypothetical protein
MCTYIPLIDKTIENRGILIVKDCSVDNDGNYTPGLMGMNFISQCREIFKSCDNTDSDIRKHVHSEVKGFARVAGQDELYVSPNSVSVVNVVGATQKFMSDQTANIKPSSGKPEVMVIDSVSTTAKNLFPVRVANRESTDLWLKPNMRIGTCIIREINCVFDKDSEVDFFQNRFNG